MQNIIYTMKQEQQDIIDGLVQSGEYENAQQVLDAAVKSLDSGADKLQRLRALIKEGDESGAAVHVDVEKRLTELRQRARA
ncbi:ribbon-helix-helix domain-containing protein [Agarilytica rhodophyticola]|uniref:ribbon-helix-helix domain-containing protein n=1 Tax=Agarilytica rhodophyticola TaxID=1737490 RepID=UPI000B34496C|nr:type II toxin-antitoxin system ParD family antitoxin [Agarilytica rhodophyticola]